MPDFHPCPYDNVIPEVFGFTEDDHDLWAYECPTCGLRAPSAATKPDAATEWDDTVSYLESGIEDRIGRPNARLILEGFDEHPAGDVKTIHRTVEVQVSGAEEIRDRDVIGMEFIRE